MYAAEREKEREREEGRVINFSKVRNDVEWAIVDEIHCEREAEREIERRERDARRKVANPFRPRSQSKKIDISLNVCTYVFLSQGHARIPPGGGARRCESGSCRKTSPRPCRNQPDRFARETKSRARSR